MNTFLRALSALTLRWAVFSICFLIFVPNSFSSTAVLTLEQALQRTLQSSPHLAVYPYEKRAAEARVIQAGLRPNPEIAFEAENVAGSGEMRGTQSAEYTLSLSQTVELGDKRDRRLSVAKNAITSSEQDYALARLEVLAETTRRYIEAVRTQALQQWMQMYVLNTEKASASAKRRLLAGNASKAETDRICIQLMRAKLALQQAQSNADLSRLRLASSWGGAHSDFGAVQKSLFNFPTLPEISVLQKRLHQSPQMTQYLTRKRLRESQLRLAESAVSPDINIGVGVRHLQEIGDNGLVVNFSMPLQINNRNQGGIAEAHANLERTHAEQSLAQADINMLLQTFYAQAKSSKNEAIKLKNEVLPLAIASLLDTYEGYTTGRNSALELIAAQDEQQKTERDSIEAASRFHLLILEIERLTGQSVTAKNMQED